MDLHTLRCCIFNSSSNSQFTCQFLLTQVAQSVFLLSQQSTEPTNSWQSPRLPNQSFCCQSTQYEWNTTDLKTRVTVSYRISYSLAAIVSNADLIALVLPPVFQVSVKANKLSRILKPDWHVLLAPSISLCPGSWLWGLSVAILWKRTVTTVTS